MSAIVTLFDPATGIRAHCEDANGATHPGDNNGTILQWTDGNYGCDCNKRLFMGRAGAPGYDDDLDADTCGDTIVLEKIVRKEDGRVLFESREPPALAKLTVLPINKDDREVL